MALLIPKQNRRGPKQEGVAKLPIGVALAGERGFENWKKNKTKVHPSHKLDDVIII